MSQPASLRVRNRAKVLRALFASGPDSRAGLAERAGLSKVTVADIVTNLVREGFLVETGKTGGAAGRPAGLLDLHPRAGTLLALDVQPGLVRVLHADLRGSDTSEAFHPAPGPAALTDAVTGLLRAARQAAPFGPLTQAVVAVPAPVGLDGLPGPSNSLPQLNAPAVAAQARAMDLPLVFENDVNLAALGELTLGAAQGNAAAPGAGIEPSFALLSERDTGIGLGLVLDGRLYRGPHGAAGELARAVWPDGLSPRPLESLADAHRPHALAYLIVALVVALDLDLLVLHDDRTPDGPGGDRAGGGPGDSPLRTRCRALLPPGVRVVPSRLGARATVLGALVAAREAAQARLAGEAPPAHPGRSTLSSPLAAPAPSAPQGRRMV